MCSKDEFSKILFKGIEVKKSEIRLKSENLHPWVNLIFSTIFLLCI